MFSFVDILLVLFILFIFGCIYWYWTIPKNLPPGPLGLPFIGSSLNYLNGSKQQQELMENIQTYGPIFKIYIANKLVIVLADYDTIQEALVKQADTFAGRPQLYAFIPESLRHFGVISSEGDLWKEHRRFALSTFRDFGVGRPILENRIQEEIEFLTERVNGYAASGQPFDMQNLITCSVSNIISQLLFGRRFSYDDEEFVEQFAGVARRVSAAGISFLSPFALSDTAAELVKWLPMVRKMCREADEFLDYVERQMNQTISTFDPDQESTNYIHAFLKVASTERGSQTYFTNTQLLTTCTDLFIAGTETTSTTIRWAILYLAHYPEIQEKLYQEIKSQVGTSALPNYGDRTNLPYAEAVVMEIQRIANLVPLGVARRTVTSTKLMGYDIPQDAIIVPFLTNVLHNSHVYPQPYNFKPERFLDSNGKVVRDPKLIPFQAGKRICLGEPLARMELFLLLVGLASRFRFYFPSGKLRPNLDPVIGFTCTPQPYEICIENRE